MPRAFSSWRLRFIGWVLAISFLTIAGRLFYLQVIANPKLQQISELNRIRLETRPAKRGEIVDRNGTLIATHQTRIVVGVDSKAWDNSDPAKLPQAAKILGLPVGTLQNALRQPKRWVKLKEGVDESAYQALEEMKLKGFYGYPTYDRVYPLKSYGACWVGFLNKGGIPSGGVETLMDFYLKGEDGWRETERDGKRRELGQFRSREVAPKNGFNVELSIDARVQTEVEGALKTIVETYAPEGVCIIVGDPHTGEILGLANYPGFDPNDYSHYPIANYRNRAISDIIEPGSTFKVVPVSGALEERICTPESIYDCGAPTAMYNGREVRLPSDHEHYGRMTVRDIIAKSSNRGAAQVGIHLGADKLYAYARAYGYGESTGIKLPGEVNGILYPPSRWDGLTISRLPMGHAVAATPLQIHSAISSIANDGVLMRPQIIRRVFDGDGKTIIDFAPTPRRQVVSVAVAKAMAQMMVKTCSPLGTAVKAEIPGYEVAGKTGTAQKLVDGHYSTTQHVASFSGFFPARAPRLAITVIIDTPHMKGVGYGGLVAAPAFKTVATRLIQYMGIPSVENPAETIFSAPKIISAPAKAVAKPSPKPTGAKKLLTR